MAYTIENFKSKKQLKEAVAAGKQVEIYQPGGIFPLDPETGVQYLGGPHYPEPHRWYAKVDVVDRIVTKVY